MKWICLFFLATAVTSYASSSEKTTGLLKPINGSGIYLEHPEFSKARLSPDGKFLAVAMHKNKHDDLAVVELKSFKVLMNKEMREDVSIYDISWVTPSRIIFRTYYAEGYLKEGAREALTILAVDANGENLKQLYPEFHQNVAMTSNYVGGHWQLMSDQLVDGTDILVEQEKRMRIDSKTIILGINVFNGSSHLYADAKIESGTYGLDSQFRPRIAQEAVQNEQTTLERKHQLWTRNLKTEKWEKSNFEAYAPSFVGFADQDKTLFYTDLNKEGLRELYRASMDESGALSGKTRIFGAPDADIGHVAYNRARHSVLFYEHGFGRPERTYISENDLVAEMKEMDGLFPNERIYFENEAGRDVLFFVKSDLRPTTFYIYNRDAKAIRPVLAADSKINPKNVVASRPIDFKTRDGNQVHGFLYLPANAKPPYPLIIELHGGPFGVKEDWGYNPQSQFLVQNGYATMRLNYRGSGGRGRKFEDLLIGHEGTTMQEDVADAALWAVQKGYAARKNICLWGVSYGGYASVMGAMKFPEIYRCAAGVSGVYDFTKVASQGDQVQSHFARLFWKEHLPKTEEETYAQSPVSLAKNLKTDLFIVHGVDDKRVSIDQARELKSELEKYGKKFQYMEYSDTGHFFTDDDMRIDFFTRLLTFMDSELKTSHQAGL